jgi:hypothetical protein
MDLFADRTHSSTSSSEPYEQIDGTAHVHSKLAQAGGRAEVNKALAYARAHVAVRLINLRYIDKGNLSGVVHENAYAEDLLEFTLAVISIMQKLVPIVINVEKTEK